MTTYLVKAHAEINYWLEWEYRIQASTLSAAISQAARNLRKEERLKRKRITRYKFDVTVLK